MSQKTPLQPSTAPQASCEAPQITPQTQQSKQTYLPLLVDVGGARTLVVGGGAVAARKAKTLVSYGADVTVVAPRLAEKLRALANAGHVRWLAREFEEDDARDMLLVFAATEDAHVNVRVEAAARAAGALISRADVASPQVITPAAVRRGSLQIAVSTAGRAPALSREIRRELEERFDPSWEGYADALGQVRALVMSRADDPARRKKLLEAAASPRYRERLLRHAGQANPEELLAAIEHDLADGEEA